MITGTHIAVISAIIVAVAIIAFTLGLFCRHNSDQELIAELDQELDARQATIGIMRRELRSRDQALAPVAAEIVHDDTVVIPSMAAIAARLSEGQTGYMQMPAWTADQELQLWVECAGAELQRYVAQLVTQAGQDAA